MSRSSKWKFEKTKVKVVFRLQFHATHVPPTGWDKLFISFVPGDTGKTSAKTTKANVRNGTCKWADPIYETTRLLQNSENKMYDEKLYKVIVAMGSSRASILGEAIINLAEYVDALKPSTAALPLQGCSYGTILHMTVQLLTSKTGFREFEQQRELRDRGLDSGINSHSHSTTNKTCSSDEASVKTKSKQDAAEISSLDEEALDSSSNTSESLCAEKQESSSIRSTVSGDLNTLSHIQALPKGDTSDQPNLFQESAASSQLWPLDNSIDYDFAAVFEENSRLRGSLELAESSFRSLKLEVNSLQSSANELGDETQKILQRLAAEFSSSEDLVKEISIMKSECLNLRDDISRLEHLKRSPRVDICDQNLKDQFQKGITVLEGKIGELLNKIYVAPHDGETKFICLELEALQNFLLDFRLESDINEIRRPVLPNNNRFLSDNVLGLDLCPPETLFQHLNLNPLGSDPVEPSATLEAMKGQILDLVRELDDSKVEKEELVKKMDQMECYYEGLVQELEENQKAMVVELQHLRNEHSASLYTLSASEAENEALRRDVNRQLQQFIEERQELEGLNKELERKVAISEAALRRARLNYTLAVDKLQKDLELLSSQVMSMFENNENLIKKALPLSHLEGEPKDIIKQVESKKISVGGDMLFEEMKRSSSLQEELYKKVEEELIRLSFVNLDLDIYSEALQESLREADFIIKIMKENVENLEDEMELSTSSQNQLFLMLQKATEDVHVLKEFRSRSILQCSDLTSQNQILENKLVSMSEENYTLAKKLRDQENTMIEYINYRSKYEACLAENAELSLRLKQEIFDREKLVDEMSLLGGDFTALKLQSVELVSLKERHEKSISFIENKLADLLESYNQQFCQSVESPSLSLKTADLNDSLLKLQEVQQDAFIKNCQLINENQILLEERDNAYESLSSLRSEFQVMTELFRNNTQDMVMKLDLSDVLVGNLETKLDSLAKKLQLSSELEENYSGKNIILLADLALIEKQLQELSCEKGLLARWFLGFDALEEELGRSKQTIVELTDEKQALDLHLHDKTQESVNLSCEVSSLKVDLKILADDLHSEKVHRCDLERKVTDLTSELKDCHEKLLVSSQKNDEIIRTRELVSNLEQEKSELAVVLSQQNRIMQELENNKSCQASLESWLLELHDYAIASDVAVVFVLNQYESQHLDLVQKLHCLEACLGELQKKYIDAEMKLGQDWPQAEELEGKLAAMETGFSTEFERIQSMMDDTEEQMILFAASKEELEILVMILTEKLREKSAELVWLEDSRKEESIKLRSECNELSNKLSEQVMKTEEFKNFSIHFKEARDKAEAECIAAREKRQAESPSAAANDTLRVAFMKEQYETKVQELKQQLTISKKHGEEMLVKLQDAIDELENKKRSEALSLKRNEELSVRLAALEAELDSAITEKREKGKGYDRMMAELECALLSLECCKEEQEKLEACLLDCEAENSQLTSELTSLKQQLNDMKSSIELERNENIFETEMEQNKSRLVFEPLQLVAQCDVIHRATSQIPTQNSDVVFESIGVEQLKSCFEHLSEELEKMKNENRSTDRDACDSSFEVSERELMQLNRANEELRNIFSLSDDTSVGENPLHKILSFEFELTESLKAKTIRDIPILSEEEVIFRSFRDINELIRQLLELKRKHAFVETELRDMHERYSRLSLQLAEVEGERQKLEMTLKTVRATRKITMLKRSSPNVASNST